MKVTRDISQQSFEARETLGNIKFVVNEESAPIGL